MNNIQYKNPRSGKVFAGLLLLVIGSILLLDKVGLFIPEWILSFPMLLIVIGLYIGVKHNFKKPAAFILIILGILFLAGKFIHFIHASALVWPVILITLGLFMIFRKNGRDFLSQHSKPKNEADFEWDKREPAYVTTENAEASQPDLGNAQPQPESPDYIDSVSIFGGVKKNIMSKNFMGGEVINFMGGAEINLSQADIHGRVVLDVTQIFGGTKIIVPPHWMVHSEMAAIFGGVDDKRPINSVTPQAGKILVIKGTSIFGGIDIRSF